ncbi:hypothetical protein CRUP_033518 [Coryphaenoides rupestris]|nr:hypothetical protein CRUP_033518 [Coryphaenoides rupestris]
MISRTWVRSIILDSMSMMSGCSRAPLINSSSVNSPSRRNLPASSVMPLICSMFFSSNRVMSPDGDSRMNLLYQWCMSSSMMASRFEPWAPISSFSSSSASSSSSSDGTVAGGPWVAVESGGYSGTTMDGWSDESVPMRVAVETGLPMSIPGCSQNCPEMSRVLQVGPRATTKFHISLCQYATPISSMYLSVRLWDFSVRCASTENSPLRWKWNRASWPASPRGSGPRLRVSAADLTMPTSTAVLIAFRVRSSSASSSSTRPTSPSQSCSEGTSRRRLGRSTVCSMCFTAALYRISARRRLLLLWLRSRVRPKPRPRVPRVPGPQSMRRLAGSICRATGGWLSSS